MKMKRQLFLCVTFVEKAGQEGDVEWYAEQDFQRDLNALIGKRIADDYIENVEVLMLTNQGAIAE